MNSICCLLLPIALCVPLSAAAQTPVYLDPDAPLPQRVQDLVRRMTLEEKVSQMTDVAAAIERLGVPEYNWWNEGLHGVARSGLATVFPQAIGLAATWNDSLMLELATVISDEFRAKHHEYVRNGKRLRYQGLTVWSPNINLFRDPRWGRGQETYGEDPYLTGRLAVPFIRGLQGSDPRYFKTIATVKHYAVHSGPEPERHEFDAVVNQRDLRESYLPHFEMALREANAYSLMCAYNRVLGAAACASKLLLQDILRGEYEFPGFVVSDCGAIDDIYRHHKIVPTAAEAAALAVKHGTDLDCGRVYPNLVQAVQQGLISEADIDVAVARLMTARMRLGMFDPPARVPYAQIPYTVLDQPAHRALARKVAQQSIVLLRNEGRVLPLRKDLRSIAVIGPNADDAMVLLGNYNGMPADPVTPLRGIREAVSTRTRVLYARGSALADSFPTFVTVPAGALRDLQVDYFSGHELTGTAAARARDSIINANWRDQAPRPDLNADSFAVRWTGVLRPARSGQYQLGLIGTMKFALYVNDSLLVRSVYGYRDEFGDPRLRASAVMNLEAGRDYRIRVEGVESYGDAQLGLVWSAPTDDLMQEAVQAARTADAVVLVLGLTPRLEGEEMDVHIAGFRGGDRTTLGLPAAQQRLLEAVVAAGKPTVLVLLNGSALAVNWADRQVPAILEAWYPGQAGGTAIADVLFGDYNPGGRLPVTFYREVSDLPAFTDYKMQGRTYRFFRGQPLYPFGHGLSYTTFRYSNLAISHDVRSRTDTIGVSVDVANTGSRVGDEVVQLYVQHINSAVERPIKDLRGFRRITLQPGEARRVNFALPALQLAYWDSVAGNWSLEPGNVRVLVGASSADIKLSGMIAVHARPEESLRRD